MLLATDVWDTLIDLVANPGGYYLNVHTAKFPDGAIRGQLTRTDANEVCTLFAAVDPGPDTEGIPEVASAFGDKGVNTMPHNPPECRPALRGRIRA